MLVFFDSKFLETEWFGSINWSQFRTIYMKAVRSFVALSRRRRIFKKQHCFLTCGIGKPGIFGHRTVSKVDLHSVLRKGLLAEGLGAKNPL